MVRCNFTSALMEKDFFKNTSKQFELIEVVESVTATFWFFFFRNTLALFYIFCTKSK